MTDPAGSPSASMIFLLTTRQSRVVPSGSRIEMPKRLPSRTSVRETDAPLDLEARHGVGVIGIAYVATGSATDRVIKSEAKRS